MEYMFNEPSDWRYVVDPNVDEPIMLINKHIGYDSYDGEGIMGDVFEKEISYLDSLGKKSINIYINSHGGSVSDGFSIFNSIYRCNTPTCTYVSGIAASIAGIIFQAGKTRKMYDYGILMVHNPAISGSDTTVEEDKVLMLIKKSLITMLSKGTKLTKEAISKLMDEETWMDSEEALKYGFADELIKTKEVIENKMVLDQLKNNDKKVILDSWKKYDNILNKIVLNKKNDTKMITKLDKVLELASNGADEKEIVNAFKEVYPTFFNIEMLNMADGETEETMNEDDAEYEDTANEVEVENAGDIIDYKAEYFKAKAEVESLKNSKINNLITNAVRLGKIKNEDVNTWKKLATNDFDGVEKIINSLSVNKKVGKDLSKVSVESHEETVAKIADIQNEAKPIITNTSTRTFEDADLVNILFKK